MSIFPPTAAGNMRGGNGRGTAGKAPFTLSQLKKAIPPHCFQRSLLLSFSYLFYDLTIICFLYLASHAIPSLPLSLRLVTWPLYWAAQGCVLIGIWVIGHECGHHGFSEYPWLNNTVGFVLHSALLVPYFSLKYSHRRHHSHHNNIEQDELFVPKPKSQLPWFSKYLHNPPCRVVYLVIVLTLGWPMYVAFNVSGRKYHRFVSHFDPYSPIFKPQERLQVVVSDAGVVAAILLLGLLVIRRGVAWVVSTYGMPLIAVNAILVFFTYLQHTHPALPHYDSSEWEWLRGALVTVDRDYGLLNKVFHNITDTHVLHHLFPSIPHYHAMEATKAIKPMLGEYYHFDDTPVYKAMWREARQCIYVEADEASEKGVLWFRYQL